MNVALNSSCLGWQHVEAPTVRCQGHTYTRIAPLRRLVISRSSGYFLSKNSSTPEPDDSSQLAACTLCGITALMAGSLLAA